MGVTTRNQVIARRCFNNSRGLERLGVGVEGELDGSLRPRLRLSRVCQGDLPRPSSPKRENHYLSKVGEVVKDRSLRVAVVIPQTPDS